MTVINKRCTAACITAGEEFVACFINISWIWPVAVALRVPDEGSIISRPAEVGGRVFVQPGWHVFVTTRSQWPCHSGQRPRCWHRLIKAGWMTRRHRSNIAVTTWPNLLSPQHALCAVTSYSVIPTSVYANVILSAST